MCKRGDIYFVDFGKNIDTRKQCGIRPVVVVSNNKANAYSPVITVVPLTSKIHKKRFLPTHVYIPVSAGCGMRRGSLALAEQVEAIDKDRLLEKKGYIASDVIMGKITKAIQIQIGAYEEYN
ncbi:type II toxin-antitoxin system PemK/MazF family toxin [Propionispora hippei]|uniref:mRNA interferase n=1 Tax=Propionispora hippei DSM 15287 TaxID=1123003 RepID=A0A1M6GIZ8_9FIRM|nr:type II toxin-antitoxin system PemK/MazF family toxin [Propionispora hippei]SHJ09892.1 mRNA-degrading endonuclease, toxin component of the MazEF toxin-antitoxin module [Propionispora hippei DSM 15287]